MKKLLASLFALSVISAVNATPIAMEDQSQLKPAPSKSAAEQYHIPPLEADLPDNAFGVMVRKGHAIFVDTKRQVPELVGNGLN